MWDHVTIRASDRDASRRFYETVLATLGRSPSHVGDEFVEWDDFSLAEARADRPPTRRLHLAFAAPSRAAVDSFWRTAVDAGFRSDGEPGLRPEYHSEYYGAFVVDPDGNSAEACIGHRLPEGANVVDHLWIGVRDLDASRLFWETVAPVLGLRLTSRREERFHMAAHNRSFALVDDGRPATEHVHLAFPVADDAAVAEFHRAAVAAGFRDNGAPGERPEYHPGYFGAFVLDPDGNNVEAVTHNRN
jgi:catechol 2,3-dioxygenase-like lactoylglutathione lyase family enzyme